MTVLSLVADAAKVIGNKSTTVRSTRVQQDVAAY